MIFNKKAFSLIEILSSILLLAGLIAIVVQLSYGNNIRVKKARQLRKTARLLELKMTELKQEFQGKDIVNLPSEEQGEFEEEENYFWSYKTQALQLPDRSLILSLIQLPDNQLNSQLVETLRSVLSDTVIELKLTVEYRSKREKEFSYSLTAYFVNYDEAPDFILSQISNIIPRGTTL
ncbi:MAG: type II secretion system protein [Oligoflexia bacterium]|nr:type II secretion system protein [Oligoflexia bacterium]